MFYLKMKYHNSLGESAIIALNLHGDRLIHKTILKNPLVVVVSFKRRKKNTCETTIIVELDIYKTKEYMVIDGQF